MAVTWFGLLQVVYFDDRQNLLRKIETPIQNRPKNIDFDEFFEGLSYDDGNELIAVSSVKLNKKTGFFFENCIYIFKIKEEKLALYGYYNRMYPPTKSNYYSFFLI